MCPLAAYPNYPEKNYILYFFSVTNFLTATIFLSAFKRFTATNPSTGATSFTLIVFIKFNDKVNSHSLHTNFCFAFVLKYCKLFACREYQTHTCCPAFDNGLHFDKLHPELLHYQTHEMPATGMQLTR